LFFFPSQQFHLRGLRGASPQLDIKNFDQVLRSPKINIKNQLLFWAAFPRRKNLSYSWIDNFISKLLFNYMF